jgi:hypothetical protein
MNVATTVVIAGVVVPKCRPSARMKINSYTKLAAPELATSTPKKRGNRPRVRELPR